MARGVGNRQGSIWGLGIMYFQGKWALGLGVSEMDLLSYGQHLELEKRMVCVSCPTLWTVVVAVTGAACQLVCMSVSVVRVPGSCPDISWESLQVNRAVCVCGLTLGRGVAKAEKLPRKHLSSSLPQVQGGVLAWFSHACHGGEGCRFHEYFYPLSGLTAGALRSGACRKAWDRACNRRNDRHLSGADPYSFPAPFTSCDGAGGGVPAVAIQP